MDFNDNRPIYLQICDSICEQVLDGTLAPMDRILSVREFGADIGVNPNTVARSYEKLTDAGIIFNKRGIGYFISAEAKSLVLETQRKEFIEKELPKIARKMKLLGIDPAEALGN